MLRIVLFLTISQHLFCETIPASIDYSEDDYYYIDDYGDVPHVPTNICHLPNDLNGSGDFFSHLQVSGNLIIYSILGLGKYFDDCTELKYYKKPPCSVYKLTGSEPMVIYLFLKK